MVLHADEDRVSNGCGFGSEIGEVLLRGTLQHQVLLGLAIQPVVVEVVDDTYRLKVKSNRCVSVQAVPIDLFSGQLEIRADESHIVSVVLSNVVITNVLIAKAELHLILVTHRRN